MERRFYMPSGLFKRSPRDRPVGADRTALTCDDEALQSLGCRASPFYFLVMPVTAAQRSGGARSFTTGQWTATQGPERLAQVDNMNPRKCKPHGQAFGHEGRTTKPCGRSRIYPAPPIAMTLGFRRSQNGAWPTSAPSTNQGQSYGYAPQGAVIAQSVSPHGGHGGHPAPQRVSQSRPMITGVRALDAPYGAS